MTADMLRQLLHLFLAYGSFVSPILDLTLVVVPGWSVLRLYRHRSRGHPLSFQREALLLIFVVYLSGLAAVTLSRNQNRLPAEAATAEVELRPDLASLTCSSASLPTGSSARSFCVRNARGNVMLFFPLGILIPRVWKRVRFRRGIQIAIALSISIEVIQHISRAFGSHRSPDVNDVILNGLGAGLGLVLVSLLRLRRDTRSAVPREARLSATAR